MRLLLYIFTCLAFTSLSAQNVNDDPRGWKLEPGIGIKSMVVVGMIELKKEAKPDSMFLEVSNYGEDGRMDSYSYRTILDKSTYNRKKIFQYWDGGFDSKTYINGSLYDSAIVRGDSAHVYSQGGRVEHVYKGDTMKEYATVNGARMFRSARALVHRDSFWDYRNAGNFSKRTVSDGKTTDTVRYFNSQAEVLVMIVNYYSESRHIIQSEYYNYGVKKFIFMRYAYNENLDMAYYLLKSRKGKPSYVVNRKFNEVGILTEERITGIRKSEGVLIKKYIYTYY
ncbi:MAG: hypothetical protein L6Q81_13835 [Bacteroidia bacterium]|nr:hypothetical protein [Bacteroidia bacterium]